MGKEETKKEPQNNQTANDKVVDVHSLVRNLFDKYNHSLYRAISNLAYYQVKQKPLPSKNYKSITALLAEFRRDFHKWKKEF